jgi:serine/threonine-protein kinase RsbW
MVIPSDLQSAKKVEDLLMDEVARCGYSESAAFGIKLALEEGLVNAVKHGCGYDSSKRIEVQYSIDAEKAVICITDEGQGFDPARVPDPRADENIVKTCGRGIMLMRFYMDEVRYNERGNQVYMVKRNNRGAQP